MKTICAVTACLLLLAAHPARAQELVVLTENLPPLNFVKGGTLVGPSVEIVREIQARVRSRSQIQVYPWARAYKRALEEENVVLFGMTHTDERDRMFKWVGPLATKRDILVAKRGSGIRIESLDDARRVRRIGTLRDDTRGQFLASRGFDNLEPVSDEQHNARKLARGRIDLWAYKQPGLKTVCDLAGVDYEDVEEVFSLRTINVSIAFSKRTPDSIVDTWRAAFDEMLADGTVKRIHDRWRVE